MIVPSSLVNMERLEDGNVGLLVLNILNKKLKKMRKIKVKKNVNKISA